LNWLISNFDSLWHCKLRKSRGLQSTARAQYHLRQIAVFLDMHPINKPEVLVFRAPEKFDAELKLVDEMTRKVLTQHLAMLSDFARRLRT
jgi:chromate reductase